MHVISRHNIPRLSQTVKHSQLNVWQRRLLGVHHDPFPPRSSSLAPASVSSSSLAPASVSRCKQFTASLPFRLVEQVGGGGGGLCSASCLQTELRYGMGGAGALYIEHGRSVGAHPPAVLTTCVLPLAQPPRGCCAGRQRRASAIDASAAHRNE